MYNNDFENARLHLRNAFSNCHDDYPRNKKKILKFLVPVEMNLYTFPTKALLTKYQLNEYIALAEACQEGNMVKFEEALS